MRLLLIAHSDALTDEFLAFWVLLNLIGVMEPVSFILLVGVQAAYAAPITTVSQSRQAEKDHVRDDHEAAEVELLFKINLQQLEILQLLHTYVEGHG